MKSEREARIQARLREVWISTRGTLEERITALEDTVALLQSGRLSSVQREDSLSAAHKLAGSIGMFGLHDGSECARSIENSLSFEHPDVKVILDAVSRLRTYVHAYDLVEEK